LREGTNTLAVEVHQVSGVSSDLSFDMSVELNMAPGPPPALVTLDQAQLSRLSPAFVAPENGVNGTVFRADPAGQGVEFAVLLADLDGGDPLQAQVGIGAAAVDLGMADLSAFDGLALQATNVDTSDWSVATFLRTAGDNFYQGDFARVGIGASETIVLDFGQIAGGIENIGQVEQIGFIIHGILDGQSPNPGNVDSAAFLIESFPGAAVIPEPSSLMLSAIGILALTIYGGQRKRK